MAVFGVVVETQQGLNHPYAVGNISTVLMLRRVDIRVPVAGCRFSYSQSRLIIENVNILRPRQNRAVGYPAGLNV